VPPQLKGFVVAKKRSSAERSVTLDRASWTAPKRTKDPFGSLSEKSLSLNGETMYFTGWSTICLRL
jgi:hypothetical protein